MLRRAFLATETATDDVATFPGRDGDMITRGASRCSTASKVGFNMRRAARAWARVSAVLKRSPPRPLSIPVRKMISSSVGARSVNAREKNGKSLPKKRLKIPPRPFLNGHRLPDEWDEVHNVVARTDPRGNAVGA